MTIMTLALIRTSNTQYSNLQDEKKNYYPYQHINILGYVLNSVDIEILAINIITTTLIAIQWLILRQHTQPCQHLTESEDLPRD